MLQPRSRDTLAYAGLGWRFLAVTIDTILASFILAIPLSLAAQASGLDLSHYTRPFERNATLFPLWVYVLVFGGLFLYFCLFELRGATPGKRLCRMTVLMHDGTPVTARAVVIRNLVRIPELLLDYVPAGIACLVSPQNQRLGDFAARTVVVRDAVAGPAARRAPLGAGPAAVPAEPQVAVATPPPPTLDGALAGLKTAAFALSGAHASYRRFSEAELAKTPSPGAVAPAADAAAGPRATEPDYAPEYAAAWYTLTDAVVQLQRMHANAEAAAASEGTNLAAAVAVQPDLAVIVRELSPYLEAHSDEAVHEAYLRVARGGAPG